MKVKLLISFVFAVGVILLLSPFSNPHDKEYYEQGHTVYIERGYPIAWRGVAIENSEIAFPMVRIGSVVMENYIGNQNWVHVVDLSVLIPYFLILFVGAYVILLKL